MTPAMTARPRSMPPRNPAARVVLVRGRTELASWPLERWGPPDLATADNLARLQLEARRVGCSIELRHPCRDLIELLTLVGLREILPASGLVEVCWQAERGEEARVEEVVVPDDPLT
jgi:hypothetical protein